MAESESGICKQNATAGGVVESAEDMVVASLEENVVTDPDGTANPIVGEEDGDSPEAVGLPESGVDKGHNGHSSPDLAEVKSSGNGTTEVVTVASQGNMSDDGKQDEVTSAKTVSNVGGESSLKTSLEAAGGCIAAKDSDEGKAKSLPTDSVDFGAEKETKISHLTEISDRQQVTDNKVTVSSSQGDMHMEDPPTAPCDPDVSEDEKADDADKSKVLQSTTHADNDDDAEKSMKASQSATYADVARVKVPEVSIKPSSPSSSEDEPKSSNRPRREGEEYTESSSPKDSATLPKPGDISEDEPKKEVNSITTEEPKKFEKLISPKPAENVVPSNTLAANNETQPIEECPEKSCAKKLDKLTKDGESVTPKEDEASANQPRNEMERESCGSEQSDQLQTEKSKTMSNVVNNSLDDIQHDVETASSDIAESNELQKETPPISEQLPDDHIPTTQGNNREHEITGKKMQEKKILSTSDPETQSVAGAPEVRRRIVSHQSPSVVNSPPPGTEPPCAELHSATEPVSHQSPLMVNSPPPGIELTRAKLHSATEPAQDPLILYGDTTHTTQPSHSTEEKPDTIKPKKGPTPYVPPIRQPTICERMMNIIRLLLLLLLATIALFGGIVIFLYISDYGESNILETVQDNSFIVNKETIVLQSQLWDGKELNILVIGRLGTGKSTLLRGLFEKNGHVVPLSLDRSREKPSLDQKRLLVNDVPMSLSVWNHPKLENVGAIIKIEELQKFDVILYTIKMSETRFPPKDSNIMKTMLEVLGTDFVSKTVFILSHANQVGSLDDQNVHQKTKSILDSKTHQWKEMIINKLNEHSEEDLKPEHFVHAGHPNEPNLYGVHWPSQVLAAIFDQLDESRRPALAKACGKYWTSALQGNYEPGSCAY